MLIIFRPAVRFLTGPRPPADLAARFLAAVIRPPLLFLAILNHPFHLFRGIICLWVDLYYGVKPLWLNFWGEWGVYPIDV